jgi:cytochrome P450
VLRLQGTDGFVAPAASVDELPGPRPLPVLGNAHRLKPGAAHSTLEQWAREYGPMYRFKVGSRSIVVLSDPVLMGEILRHRPDHFGRGARLARAIDEIGLAGVFSAEGDRWRRQRRLVMRALTPEAVRHFFPIIGTVTERLRARWLEAARAGRPADVLRDLKRYSIDVTTWLAMGVDVNTLVNEDNPLQSDVEFMFETIGRRFLKPIPYWRWIKLPADRRADEVVRRLGETVSDLIRRARERLDADPALRAKPSNILEALLVARDEPGSEFTDDDVRGNVATMLFAGEDTTANAMAWLLMLLARSPEHAGRVTAEADRVLGGEPVLGRFAELQRLEYLEAAATESMRLRPIAPQNGATALAEADLAGLRVSKGQLLIMLSRPSALDAHNFPDPDAYRPERWLGENAESADDTRRRIFPFGGGPRYCPGRYLAMVEIKMVASMAFAGFRVSLADDPDSIEEHFTFTMGPARLPMRFAERGPLGAPPAP